MSLEPRSVPPIRIVFIGDATHPNAQSWLNAVRAATPCAIETWSLPSRAGRLNRVLRVMAWASAALRMRQIVAARVPDLVIAYRTTSYGFLGALSGFHPLVVAAQGETDVWPVNTWTTPIKRWMARVSLRHADLVHAWGDHIAREQVSLGASPAKVLVGPRGVDLEKFYPRPGGPVLDRPRLVTTRSLFPEYRHDVIISAVAELAAQGLAISLDIVGTGPRLPDLRRQVERLGVAAHVRFHGRLDHDALPSILRECNVYVATPVTEGVSASLLEAMACGCYPIVSDLVANRHWITPGENGDLVQGDSAAALASAIGSAWRDRTAIARAMKYNVRCIREEASLHKNIDLFIGRYRALIADARNPMPGKGLAVQNES
jgi:glycosyltransferase involved in cell wall biosynthesis